MLKLPIHRKGEPRPARFALVDQGDGLRLGRFVWTMDGKGYVHRQEGNGSGSVRKLYLHREVLGLVPGDGLVADHRNGDPLDNRRENLRVVTRVENAQNGRRRGGSSRHRGVCRAKANGKWAAYGTVGGRQHHLGFFDTEAEAARVAKRWRGQHLPFSVER